VLQQLGNIIARLEGLLRARNRRKQVEDKVGVEQCGVKDEEGRQAVEAPVAYAPESGIVMAALKLLRCQLQRVLDCRVDPRRIGIVGGQHDGVIAVVAAVLRSLQVACLHSSSFAVGLQTHSCVRENFVPFHNSVAISMYFLLLRICSLFPACLPLLWPQLPRC
jgi:hypothetical protein